MTTAADLRAAIARERIPLYQLAAAAGLHPTRLGGMLNGRLPLREDVRERVAEILLARAAER